MPFRFLLLIQRVGKWLVVTVCLTTQTPTEYNVWHCYLTDSVNIGLAVLNVHVESHSQSIMLSSVLQFGGLPSLHHNEIYYLTANFMIGICLPQCLHWTKPTAERHFLLLQRIRKTVFSQLMASGVVVWHCYLTDSANIAVPNACNNAA